MTDSFREISMQISGRKGNAGATMTKQGIVIRKGQRRPYTKGTQKQIDERLGFVVRLLERGANRFAIHRAVKCRFNIEWRQCDRYIARLTWLTRKGSSKYDNSFMEQLRAVYGNGQKTPD